MCPRSRRDSRPHRAPSNSVPGRKAAMRKGALRGPGPPPPMKIAPLLPPFESVLVQREEGGRNRSRVSEGLQPFAAPKQESQRNCPSELEASSAGSVETRLVATEWKIPNRPSIMIFGDALAPFDSMPSAPKETR